VDPFGLRDLAVELARAAGSLLARRRPDDLGADTKSTPTDVVTVMDRAAEALIVDRLREIRPDDAVLGEEGGARTGTTGVRWIVDPLDGTVNYLYGIPAYGVSIAAEVDGHVVAGAVYDALHKGVHEAVRGHGARSEGVPLRCSGADRLELSLVGTGFAYAADTRAGQGRLVGALLPRVRDIRRIGAAALDLCAVGAGNLDAYFERGLKPWDRAAGMLIAAEAGARVNSLPDGDDEITVAAAPGVFDALVGELTRLRR
jgi:myo-inositol-1(or 4)-monophosphatase